MISWILELAAQLYGLCFLMRIVSEFFPELQDLPVVAVMREATQPVVVRLRGYLGYQGRGFDFSPVVAMVGVLLLGKVLGILF